MSQIAAWLVRLSLSKYAEAFAIQEVDFEVLRHLSDDDLKDLACRSERGVKFWRRSQRAARKEPKRSRYSFESIGKDGRHEWFNRLGTLDGIRLHQLTGNLG